MKPLTILSLSLSLSLSVKVFIRTVKTSNNDNFSSKFFKDFKNYKFEAGYLKPKPGYTANPSTALQKSEVMSSVLSDDKHLSVMSSQVSDFDKKQCVGTLTSAPFTDSGEINPVLDKDKNYAGDNRPQFIQFNKDFVLFSKKANNYIFILHKRGTLFINKKETKDLLVTAISNKQSGISLLFDFVKKIIK